MRVAGLSQGVEGVKAAEAMVERSARRVYEATLPTDRVTLSSGAGLADAMVEGMKGAALYRANLASIKTADRVAESLMELVTRR